jgi:membrane-bound acyltransferase YfiQ involved in biofilm formation
MPASETAAISFGNWIISFYIVYAVAAIAVVAALAVFISWTVNRFKGGRLTSEAKVGRRAGAAQSQA